MEQPWVFVWAETVELVQHGQSVEEKVVVEVAVVVAEVGPDVGTPSGELLLGVGL